MDFPDAALPPSDPTARSRSRRPRQSGSPIPVSPLAPLAHALLLGGATASVFLASGPLQGSLAIFLLCAGTAMIVCPPRVKVEWRLWVAAAGLLACCASALLPEHTVSQPGWRRVLDETPPIVMPGTISAAPALTMFWVAILALTLLAGLFALAQPIRSRWLLGFALTAALAAGVYGALAIYAQETGWRYPFTGGASFGFFANRNHTATLLFVGSLVALGVLGAVLREGRWLAGSAAAASGVVCVAGLGFFSPSRAGVVFLVTGIVVWIAGLGRRHLDRRLVVSFVSLLLAGGILFLFTSGEVRDRLLGRTPDRVATFAGGNAGDIKHGLSADLRLNIYRDTLGAVRDFPLTGTGLGSFIFVFPQYRHASLSEAIVLHPESDWLMLAAEAGIPAVLCLLTLSALALGRLRAERDHPYWPLRWGCAVAAVMAVFHGTVDTPAHIAPLGWWVLAVAGLALQSARLPTGGPSRAQRVLFIGGGVAALAMGTALARAEWFGGRPLPPFSYGADVDEFYHVLRPDPSRALRLAQAMTRAYPMEEHAYAILGETLCLFDGTEARVDAAFHAERLLEPDLTVTPLDQGRTWLGIDPVRASALWCEAMERHIRNFRLAGPAQRGTPAQFYGELLSEATGQPVAQRALWNAVDHDPELVFTWVEDAAPALARERLSLLANDDHFLRGLDAAGQRRFLRDWRARGDRDALTVFLKGDLPTWQVAARFTRLELLADAGQYAQAVRDGAAQYGVSLALPEPGSENATPPTAEQETGDPVAAFLAYWRMGNVQAARRVLGDAPEPTPAASRAEFWRLRTASAVHDADWPAAWHALQQAIALTHPGETF